MCDPVVASFGSSAMGAIGSAAEASAQNKAAERNYQHKLKIRERKWMMDTSLFKTKTAQFEKNISEKNLAAYKAYHESQVSLNNVFSDAMLDHQKDLMSVLEAEGIIEAGAAERGVRGSSITKMLNMNLAKLGMANAARSRALTESQYAFKLGNENIRNQLISDKNTEWSKVSTQLVPDMEPVEPVKKNVGLTLFTGLAGAAFDAGGAWASSKSNTKISDSKDII
tara:strand:- start:937 stop:1611 length:675 start_codon:yes stop_codon:yes gene_type:complete